jgi:2-polyprenyl-6-methoxyphenol hydroxylase-like FAD-dependent oxidoreductase
MADSTITAKCCIAGGGPAGMMLGFLLARAGVDVVVLEKHADFFRDFRGDTVHPSTLELMSELGLIDAFLKLPHQKVETLTGQVGAERLKMADFRHLPTRCKFIALTPQWDFLNFLAEQAERYKTFHLQMNTEATDLVEESGRIIGLHAKTPSGTLTIRADLVVGCDGRHSTVREKAGLKSDDYGAPMDVLWFRMSRKGSDSTDTFGHIEAGRLMVMLDRGDYRSEAESLFVRILAISANLKLLRSSILALCRVSLRRAGALHSPEIEIEQGVPFVALVPVLLAQAQDFSTWTGARFITRSRATLRVSVCAARGTVRGFLSPKAQWTTASRKNRSSAEGFPNRSYRPEADLPDRPYERVGSARKRTLAEAASCAGAHIRTFVGDPAFSRCPAEQVAMPNVVKVPLRVEL